MACFCSAPIVGRNKKQAISSSFAIAAIKVISESVGASDGGTAKDKFFAEIDGPLNDRYVGLLTDGSNGAYGYSGVEPSEETKKAACQALVEFIY